MWRAMCFPGFLNLLLGLTLLLQGVPPVQARRAVFIQGISDANGNNPDYKSDDCRLFGPAPGASGQTSFIAQGNWGAAPVLAVGREPQSLSRILYRFDLRSLAGHYRSITRARLILTMDRSYAGGDASRIPLPLDLTLHAIDPSNGAWCEGTSFRGDPDEGAASWAWLSASRQPWAGQAGCGQPGVDYQASALAAHRRTTPYWQTGERWLFELQDMTLIEQWIQQPAANAGLLLRSSTLEDGLTNEDIGLISFFADDCTAAENRPRLEVDYEPILVLDEKSTDFGASGGSGNDSMGTSIFSGVAQGCYGGAADLCAGVEPSHGNSQQWRSLLKFDLSGLRELSQQVTSARLILTVQSVAMPAEEAERAHTLDLHRLTQANAAWREGALSDGGEESGAATWKWLGLGVSAWAGGELAGAGVASAGLDYLLPPVASTLFAPSGLHAGDTLALNFSETSFLQDWIASPASNAGLRLGSPSLELAGQTAPALAAHIRFFSDDAVELQQRPRLELIYRQRPNAARPTWTALE